MRIHLILIAAVAAFAGTGCKSIDCGDGTIERNGVCVGADESPGTAMCGPFTELQGDKCVPMFPPTECDPGTTSAEVDAETGVTTCVGTGSGGGCSAAFACPLPATGKQTICGQIYDFENNTPFAATGATGAKCAAPTATGPCALTITAYEALAFAANPSGTPPLATGGLYIDDCGRYRVTDISQPGTPFIGLGVDDAMGTMGPAGVTNTTAVAVPKSPGAATKDVEAFIVKKSTSDMWTASGGPSVATGWYAAVFRAHRVGMDSQAGVTITKSGSTIPNNDFYFQAAQTSRQTIDPAATATGMNGTVLVNNAVAGDGLVFSASTGLPAECRWESHAGATIPGIVFIALFLPTNVVGQTCPL
jgi:hypothetical protein